MYISNRELDELGEGLIRNYLRRSGVCSIPRCIDIEGFANFLGLHVAYEAFGEKDPDKIGFLADGKTPLTVRRGKTVAPVTFPFGTIVLDASLHQDRESGKCRFTIAHEAAHYILNRHNPVPQFQRIYDVGREYTIEEMRRQFNMLEIQADRLAASLLMPHFIMNQALNECHQGKPVTAYGESFIFSPEERRKIHRMADQVGVSYSAFVYRLRQFEMIEHHPLEEYIEQNLLKGVTA